MSYSDDIYTNDLTTDLPNNNTHNQTFKPLSDYNLDYIPIDNNVKQIRVTFNMNKNVSSLFENYTLTPNTLSTTFTIIKFKDLIIDILQTDYVKSY